MNTQSLKHLFLSLSVFALVLVLGCKDNNKTNTPEPTKDAPTASVTLSPVEQMEKVHHKTEFLSKDAILFDLKIQFGGKERLDGTMTLLTNSTKGKLELTDGTAIYFDGDTVYHSPDLKNPSGARFDAYTWMYFLLFPTKMSDPGTVWSQPETTEMNGNTYTQQKLSFKPETGDAPDDWYEVYSNPETHEIAYLGYIVTANKTVEAAEASPHAIGYTNYVAIDNVPIPMAWTFYEWTKNSGLGDTIGHAKLANVKFVETTEHTFSAPDDFIKK